MKQMETKLTQSYLELPQNLYAKTRPAPVAKSEIVIFNHKLAETLSLEFMNDPKVLTGQVGDISPSIISQAYAGHQFGHFTMLGDGRAHLLGEHAGFDIALKGSGQTPFSRRGDGLASLGPMLREYLISEAMAGLGIPTTRSLAVVKTADMLVRQSAQPGGVLCRVASSHIRVGTFQYVAALNDRATLEALMRYSVKRHYPELLSQNLSAEALAKAFLLLVIERQAALVIKWLQVGFIHGVMNTDNVAISGETIDYGPCAFMDEYHPETVFSSIDERGRYAFARQPEMMIWNLARFAETLAPLFAKREEEGFEIAQDCLERFGDMFSKGWLDMMRAKLGILGEADKDDGPLAHSILHWMQEEKRDYTNTFRNLEDMKEAPWHSQWQARIGAQDPQKTRAKMAASNPAVIARNHWVEAALNAATLGEMKTFCELLEVLQTPFEPPKDARFMRPPLEHERVRATFCGT